MSAAQEFIEQYGRAFAHADVDALVECFAFPVQVVSVAEDRASVSVAGPGDWQGVLEGLLGAYERLRVADVVPLAVEVSEPIYAVAVVRVHWRCSVKTAARSTSSRRSTRWCARTTGSQSSRSHTTSCPSYKPLCTLPDGAGGRPAVIRRSALGTDGHALVTERD